jgi:acyl carrier protein
VIEWNRFAELLARYAKTESVAPDDILFGAGLDLSSIRFVEFIMELEEEFGLDIDVDDLNASIKTAGQLHQRISQEA